MRGEKMARPRKIDAEKKILIKEKAQIIESYLNRLEHIFSTYSVGEQNGEKITEISMISGKVMISFSDFCNLLEVFKED
jgi:hypothetical protein